MAIDGNVLDSFWIRLGFEVTDEGIQKFEEDFEKLRNVALGVGAAFVAALTGVGLFVDEVSKTLGDMEHFAKVNHLSVEELQAFNAIARENHIDVGTMDQGIAELNKRLGQAQLGTGRLLPILKKLGIGLKDTHGHAKDVGQILGDIANKMQKFEKAGEGAKNLGLASRLGLDPGMVELLNKGAASWNDLFQSKKANVAFTKEELERAEATDKLFVRFKHDIEVMWDRIALRLMPAVDKLLAAFKEWFDAMMDDPASLFNQSLEMMGGLADWVADNLDTISKVVIPALIFGFTLLSAKAIQALGEMGWAAFLSIGSMIEQLGALSIAELIALAPIWVWIAAIAAVAAAAYLIYDNWDSIVQWFGEAWDWLGGKIQGVLDKINKMPKWAAFMAFGPKALDLMHPTEGVGAQPFSSGLSSPQWGASSSSTRTSSVTHYVNVPNLTVISPDPEKAGQNVRDALNPSHNRSLIRNAQSGKVY